MELLEYIAMAGCAVMGSVMFWYGWKLHDTTKPKRREE